MTNSQPTRTDLLTLDRLIKRSRLIAWMLIVLVPTGYMLWFVFVNGRTLSTETGAWGEFGDFVGGFLNPLLAFFAFFWLTQSVKLQKEELQETRAAIEASTAAQEEQARHARTTARVAALTAVINAISAEVQMQRTQAQFLVDQISRQSMPSGARLLGGDWKSLDDVFEHLKVLSARIEQRMTERYQHEQELHMLLDKHK
jgi:hypothetical protein